MRILYIAFDNPAVDTILGGMNDEKLSGLPAFYFPFKMLTEQGHTVDILLFSPQDKTVTESKNFKKENLIHIKTKHNGFIHKLKLPFLLYRETKKQLKKQHYDFVYGMSEGSHMGVRAAEKLDIPCGLRQFGTQEMANVLETVPKGARRFLKALKDYTYITLSMLSKKSFILATNDGSRADELYDILGIKKKKFDFYFWRSAVMIPDTQPPVDSGDSASYPDAYDPMALSHIGRIADVKRQDRSAKILGELHKRGCKMHLYLIGTVDSEVMYNETLKVADEYGVSDYVHFVGGKSQSDCRRYARNSFASLLTGEWNRVNIFYEIMGEGSLVLTNNNHSIDEFIDNGVNCLVYDNEAEAAEMLIALQNDAEKIGIIRSNAHKTAIDKFMTVEKRFGMEVKMVLDYAAGKKNDYPTVV